MILKLFLEVFFFFYPCQEVNICLFIYLFPKVIFFILPKVIFLMRGSGYFVFYISGSHFKTFSRSFLFVLFMTRSDYLFIYLFISQSDFFFMTGSGYFVFYITGSAFKNFPGSFFSSIYGQKWLFIYFPK